MDKIMEWLIPVEKWTRQRGRLKLAGPVKLSSMLPADKLPLQGLKDELKATGARSRVVMGAREADLIIRRDRAIRHPEGYRLTIGKDSMEIVSAADAGAYYAVQTLRDMIRLNGCELPCGCVEDSPAIERRAVYHDCARGKVPKVETVKQLIECLARWKINELQLYIENAFTFEKHPAIGKGFSPYTPDDILEMQAHAKKHHVRFAPSLTSFGHFEKILALPEYQHLGELPGSRGMPGGTTLRPGDPGSIKLLEDMYSEFLPLFEAEDFNACGDEPWELGEGRSKRRAARVGVGQVYLDFIMKIRDLCARHGKRLNIWADIVMKRPEALPGMPRDVVLCNWDYGIDGRRVNRTHELRDYGFSFVCCPGTGNSGSHGTRLSIAMKNISMFAKAARENNAEGLMTTDWGNVGHRTFLGVSLCSLALGAAHAWRSEHVDDAKHIRRFTNLVFGDPQGEMAKCVIKLNTPPFGASQPSYWSMLESLTKSEPLPNYGHVFDGFRIENVTALDTYPVTEKDISERIGNFGSLKWPKPTRRIDEFFTLAMEEFEAAARMEKTGWERLRLARELRRGDPVKSKNLMKHADAIEAYAEDLSRLWKARNRPSRLRDNISQLRAGAAEARKLAKRQ